MHRVSLTSTFKMMILLLIMSGSEGGGELWGMLEIYFVWFRFHNGNYIQFLHLLLKGEVCTCACRGSLVLAGRCWNSTPHIHGYFSYFDIFSWVWFASINTTVMVNPLGIATLSWKWWELHILRQQREDASLRLKVPVLAEASQWKRAHTAHAQKRPCLAFIRHFQSSVLIIDYLTNLHGF